MLACEEISEWLRDALCRRRARRHSFLAFSLYGVQRPRPSVHDATYRFCSHRPPLSRLRLGTGFRRRGIVVANRSGSRAVASSSSAVGRAATPSRTSSSRSRAVPERHGFSFFQWRRRFQRLVPRAWRSGGSMVRRRGARISLATRQCARRRCVAWTARRESGFPEAIRFGS